MHLRCVLRFVLEALADGSSRSFGKKPRLQWEGSAVTTQATRSGNRVSEHRSDRLLCCNRASSPGRLLSCCQSSRGMAKPHPLWRGSQRFLRQDDAVLAAAIADSASPQGSRLGAEKGPAQQAADSQKPHKKPSKQAIWAIASLPSGLCLLQISTYKC